MENIVKKYLLPFITIIVLTMLFIVALYGDKIRSGMSNIVTEHKNAAIWNSNFKESNTDIDTTYISYLLNFYLEYPCEKGYNHIAFHIDKDAIVCQTRDNILDTCINRFKFQDFLIKQVESRKGIADKFPKINVTKISKNESFIDSIKFNYKKK